MERFRSACTDSPSQSHEANEQAPLENTAEKKVRGRPFENGNPGRPLGARNKITVIAEQMLAGETDRLVRKLLELAQAGDTKCLQLCLDRVLPKRSGRTVRLQLPPVANVHDLVGAMTAVTAAVADGELTVEEAERLARLYSDFGVVLETRDLLARVEALESRADRK